MKFRSKSPKRVLEELAQLSDQYRAFNFEAVDNILDNGFFSSLLPAIVKQGSDYKFFFELKSNLSRERVQALSQAGITRIQPGIESLSSRVLALMKKGVSALQNLNTLRWCRYYGITVVWNLLWGFPGETEADYAAQSNLICKLHHLEPPLGGGRIWLERYSPYYFDRAAFPLEYIRPLECYEYIYPAHFDKELIAYFFDYKFKEQLDDKTYIVLRQRISEWQLAWTEREKPTLKYLYSPRRLIIEDLRVPMNPMVYSFDQAASETYQASSRHPISINEIMKRVESAGIILSKQEIQHILDEFCGKELMVTDQDRYLSLALPALPNRG